jgi:hypothetical protein
MYQLKQNSTVLILTIFIVALVFGCKKYEHYIDGGVKDAKFNGTVLQYLQSKPLHFDTLAQVIKLAGMESVFDRDEITFFAPTDPTIGRAIKTLNTELLYNGKDTVKTLSDIKPAVWKAALSLYIFKGTNRLKDYNQVDTLALNTYKGQGYISYNGAPMNIGVVYNDAVTNAGTASEVRIKYAGYRQLMISYIPDLSRPQAFWINAPVASSDINPSNGIVHALKMEMNSFGFNSSYFNSLAIENGIGN